MIFFENKTEYFLKTYNDIINYLINSNFINFNTEIIYPSTTYDFYSLLINYFPSEELLVEKISEYFSLPIFEEKSNNYSVNDLGVVQNDTFYFFDIFSQKSFIFYNQYKKYGIIKKYGIVSNEVYKNLLSKRNNSKEDLSFKIDSIIQKAIFTNTEEIFISYNGTILFKTHGNSYYLEDTIFLPHDFNFQKLNFNFENKKYSILVNKILFDNNINFSFKILEENQYLFANKKIRHYDKLNNYIYENKGIILLSSKNNNYLYYDTLKKVSESDKKVISFDNNKDFKIDNIINVNYSKFDTSHDLSLFDVVFINNINEYKQIFLKAVELGKLVIVFINNKDCLSSVLNILELTKINKYVFSENFLCSLHYSELPHLCNDCKIEKTIKELPILSQDIYSMYNYGIGKNPLFVSNKKGCNSCIKGYSKKVYISEILENDNDICDYIERNFNIRQLRNFIKSKRWEGEEENSLYLLKKGDISIEDIKKYS